MNEQPTATPDALVPNSAAWQEAWDELCRDPWNAGIADLPHARDVETGETWRYTGPVEGGQRFEHRCHPRTASKIVVVVKSETADEPVLAESEVKVGGEVTATIISALPVGTVIAEDGTDWEATKRGPDLWVSNRNHDWTDAEIVNSPAVPMHIHSLPPKEVARV